MSKENEQDDEEKTNSILSFLIAFYPKKDHQTLHRAGWLIH